MNIYKPIIIVGIIVASVTVGLAMYDQLTAATRDKKSECNTKYIELTHRIERVIGAKHDQMQSLSGRFRLSDDYQIRTDISSIINDVNQLRADCRDVIDLTQPPSGYSYEEWQIIDKIRRDRILVIDDEPDICSLYQMVLQDAG